MMTDNITVTITTPSDREAVVTRTFSAPRQLVFDALTKPELIERWYGPPGSIEVCESDPVTGGKWRFVSMVNGRRVCLDGLLSRIARRRRRGANCKIVAGGPTVVLHASIHRLACAAGLAGDERPVRRFAVGIGRGVRQRCRRGGRGLRRAKRGGEPVPGAGPAASLPAGL